MTFSLYSSVRKCLVHPVSLLVNLKPITWCRVYNLLVSYVSFYPKLLQKITRAQESAVMYKCKVFDAQTSLVVTTTAGRSVGGPVNNKVLVYTRAS